MSDWTEEDYLKYEQGIEAALDKYEIPGHMRNGVIQYIMRGRNTGSFLTNIFSNDFIRAVGRADEENLASIVNYVKFIVNHAPIPCYGSEEKVHSWMSIGGLRGTSK